MRSRPAPSGSASRRDAREPYHSIRLFSTPDVTSDRAMFLIRSLRRHDSAVKREAALAPDKILGTHWHIIFGLRGIWLPLSCFHNKGKLPLKCDLHGRVFTVVITRRYRSASREPELRLGRDTCFLNPPAKHVWSGAPPSDPPDDLCVGFTSPCCSGPAITHVLLDDRVCGGVLFQVSHGRGRDFGVGRYRVMSDGSG